MANGNNETAEKCEKSVDIANKRTNEMTYFMDDLSLNSPRDRQSRSRSKTYSVKQRSSSRSLSSSQSDSSSSSSSSRSRSRSHSRERRYKNTKSRSSSRSYSRDRSRSYSKSHSRSYSPRERRRYSSAYRRYYRSPPRYRSRSRSYSRYASRHRSHYSRSRSRSSGRRFYGFVRRPYSPTFRSYKSRSRTRSRSRTPLRLSLKEKQELLEIAKANASKALGKTIELPESLKKDLKNEQSRKAEDVKNCDRSRNSREFFWLFQKSNKNPKKIQEKLRDVKPKSPYMLWRPVTSEAKLFSNGLSPKRSTTSRSR